MAAATVLATSGIAYADNIQDDIVDDKAGLTVTAGGGASGPANVRVVANNSEGDQVKGCNIATGSSLTLDVVTPAGVTASPDPMIITECGKDFPVTFTAGAGAASGVATVDVPATAAGYKNQVSIPITVTQPAATNTAPVVGVTGVADGETYRVGGVPEPGCSVTDAEDTDESATPQVSNGAYDALGQHTVTCSYTDGGTLTGSAAATYTVLRALDTTAPVITYTLTPVDGSNGWHTGTAILDWTVTEAESSETLTNLVGCDDVTITADQRAADYTCSASSEGGNASSGPVTIKRDGTAPTVTAEPTVGGTLGDNGWYTSDVSVTFNAADALSGLLYPDQSPAVVTSSGEGSAITVTSPAFLDAAGNEREAGSITRTFKIDKTAPTVDFDPVAGVSGSKGNGDWYTSDVEVTFDASDATSGVSPSSQKVRSSGEGAAVPVASPAFTDNAGNTREAGSATPTFKIDKTAPEVTYGRVVSGTEGSNGWYTSDVTVEFDATDGVSGVSPSSKTATSSGQGVSVVVLSPAFADVAGNERAAGAASRTFMIDTDGPTDIEFTGLPSTQLYYGDAAPTVGCTAKDTVSLVATCVVTGVESSVGTHILTATATDNAGNRSTRTTAYTVLPWTTQGFYAPVDMSTQTTTVYNTVKGGSTVPLKFELFAGSTELTATSAIKAFTAAKVSCTSGAEDLIETLATTGGTSLRYDTTAGQFVQNWKTPTGTACYKATMTAQDGSTIVAYFKTK